MEEDLAALKRTLISLVVSSPTTMTVYNLVKDYRNMVGGEIPVSKFGYRDIITFIRERCLDIFVVEGTSRDPILTPKVTENLKHIDQMVQKQKVQSSIKYKGKRRSVSGAVNHSHTPNTPLKRNLVCETFKSNNVRHPPNNHNKPSVYRETTPVHRAEPKVPSIKETNVPKPLLAETTNHNQYKHEETVAPCNSNGNYDTENISNSSERTSSGLSKLYKQRHQYTSKMDLQGNHVDGSSKGSNDSGAHSLGSSSSKLEEMKNEIVELIRASAEGVWFTDLMRLYKEEYGRELNLHCFGHTSLGKLVSSLQDRIAVTRPDSLGDFLLQDPASVVAAGCGRGMKLPLQRSARNHSRRDLATNPDDALPGIESDADVYPEDCMHYLDTIPSADISALAGGSQLEVLIGEVYSPSHFWLQQVGPEHNLAMEIVMDRMNEHYMTDARQLAPGALRVGQYCAALYEKDWHRCLIVEVIDSDTVKVRHVDYGTVDTVTTSDLRYLPREFGQLRAQAVRALLAACRPSARGQRWSHAAATDFLRAVKDKRLYANILVVDREEDILETFLTDTSGETDVCLSRTLVRLGHADPRYDSALARDESYLYPRFDALETASTPNYADICRLLDDGIELDFVDAYRQHVPGLSTAPLSPPAPPSQYQTSQPPISRYQTVQSQYRTTQSQYQTAQARLLQIRTPQLPHSQYPTSRPPPSQVQTPQAAFQLLSQCKGTQPPSSQYQQMHSQGQSLFSLLQSQTQQSQAAQNPLSQLQSVQPPSTIPMMHPSLEQTQMLHPSPRPSPQPILPKPQTHWPAHVPLVPSQAVHSSVEQTRSSQPFILPTLPVGPRQLPRDRRVLLPTPPLPTFMPTVRPTPSSTQPLAQPYFQPTAPGVPPPFGSTQGAHSSVPFQPSRSSPPAQPAPSTPAQPAPSAPAQPAPSAPIQPAPSAPIQPAPSAPIQPASTAMSQPSQSPTIPPGFKSPGAVPPMPNEVRLTEEEWTVLEHLRATDPTAAEYFLTLTAWRAVIAHRHALPQSMRSFDSTPAGDSGGRRTAAADSDK